MVRRSKFSERIGALPVPSVLQTDGISDELRTSLWNLLLISFDNLPYGQKIIDYIWVCKSCRCNDDSNDYTRTHMIKGAFFKLPWYKVLDIIEDTSLVMSAWPRLLAIVRFLEKLQIKDSKSTFQEFALLMAS